MDSLPINKYVATAVVASLLYVGICRRRTSKVYPPGPPADLIIGHARVFPLEYFHTVFADWGKKFGNIIYVHILGRPIVIINSLDVARELLEKRGVNYSDRPTSTLYDMMNWSRAIFCLPYGDRWRPLRRMIAEKFTPTAVKTFFPVIETEVNDFLRRFESDPLGYKTNMHRLFSSMTINLVYGYRVTTDNDPYVASIEHAAYLTAKYTPGAVPVDFLPILRFLPAWFPGAGFVSHAKETDVLIQGLCDELNGIVTKQRTAGTAAPSLMAQWQEDYENSELPGVSYEDLKLTGFCTYVAGVETTESTLLTFFIMIIHHPEVAKAAQIELDAFIAEEGRLPSLQDRPRLPYIDCILKETFRASSPAPMSIPHVSQNDDEYEGMFIPGGSMIMSNIWYGNMMNDESVYPSPSDFNPERFIQKDGDAPILDPTDVVFGFGRRICPGRHFADSALWLAIASVLSVYDILPPIHPKTGKEVLPKIEFTSAVTIHPKPFDCRVIPRSAKHLALLHGAGDL
ncbi:cytochrome P450 [Schizopora paradoxa]|uniref:Cytochrome P450 n=1 Tax=Schizopora paradoxa TaxID=27342 RepID=A0A0H2S0D5_9AGAM|nr:cytochrome P450 [Schizopora paradoxa]